MPTADFFNRYLYALAEIHTSFDLEATQNAVVRNAVMLYDARGASLMLFNASEENLIASATFGLSDAYRAKGTISPRKSLGKVMPFATVGFIIGSLVSMGMPGFSGFVAEFSIFMGVWQEQWLVAVIASISIVITAAYIMRNIRQVFFGDMPAKLEGHITDVTLLDKVAIAFLCMFMIVIGLIPSVMVPMVQTGVNYVMDLLPVVQAGMVTVLRLLGGA